MLDGAQRLGPQSFAVVSLVAVLEHLVDPASTLCARSAELLRPNGVLYLLVPDAARFTDHVDAPYQEFSVEHINYFTAASLRNLLGSVGLDVVAERDVVLHAEHGRRRPGARGVCAAEMASVRRRGPYRLGWRRRPASTTSRASADEGSRGPATIATLADDQSPIYVWGTGTHTPPPAAVVRLG